MKILGVFLVIIGIFGQIFTLSFQPARADIPIFLFDDFDVTSEEPIVGRETVVGGTWTPMDGIGPGFSRPILYPFQGGFAGSPRVKLTAYSGINNTVNPPSADYFVEYIMEDDTSGASPHASIGNRLMMRHNPSAVGLNPGREYYVIDFFRDQREFRLRRFTADDSINLDVYGVSAGTIEDPRTQPVTVRIQAEGDSITGYINNELRLSATNDDISNPGFIGFGVRFTDEDPEIRISGNYQICAGEIGFHNLCDPLLIQDLLGPDHLQWIRDIGFFGALGTWIWAAVSMFGLLLILSTFRVPFMVSISLTGVLGVAWISLGLLPEFILIAGLIIMGMLVFLGVLARSGGD